MTTTKTKKAGEYLVLRFEQMGLQMGHLTFDQRAAVLDAIKDTDDRDTTEAAILSTLPLDVRSNPATGKCLTEILALRQEYAAATDEARRDFDDFLCKFFRFQKHDKALDRFILPFRAALLLLYELDAETRDAARAWVAEGKPIEEAPEPMQPFLRANVQAMKAYKTLTPAERAELKTYIE